MIKLIEDFKKRMRADGRSFKWFHRTFLDGISYSYFIIQINDKDRLSDEIKRSIEKYLSDK